MTIIVAFAITFVILSFVKSAAAMYLASFIYMFSVVVLGGVVIPGVLTNGTGVEKVH